MSHPLQCRCGQLRGRVALSAPAVRTICYCPDCRTFARFLPQADAILDASGGTELVATEPSAVVFEHGLDALACMSLSERGLLRWFSTCCRTPIGNTPRDRRMHYVGLVHSCLATKPLEPSFGPVRLRVNTNSATGPVPPNRVGGWLSLFTLLRSLGLSRITGRYRQNPFFPRDDGEPLTRPHVVSRAQRRALSEPS